MCDLTISLQLFEFTTGQMLYVQTVLTARKLSTETIIENQAYSLGKQDQQEVKMLKLEITLRGCCRPLSTPPKTFAVVLLKLQRGQS